jgi:hypothetical protein
MQCDTCKDSGNPGYVVHPPADPNGRTFYFVPCPDCGGTGVAHCCDGLRAQPDDG